MSHAEYKEWWMDYRASNALQDPNFRVVIAREPLIELKPPEQAARPYSAVGKPNGLWYSFGTAWLDWCLEEGGAGFLGRYVYAILVDLSDMLVLSTPEAICTFTQEYYEPLDPTFSSITIINWERVAQHCSGVEINPYQWSRRLDPNTFWYYSWDVASGCIWEPTALVDFELLAECPIPNPKRRNKNEGEEIQRECSS